MNPPRLVIHAALLALCLLPSVYAAEQRVLMLVTSHAALSGSGKPTGAFAPEIAHPCAVFAAAGYGIDLASPKGGRMPLYGEDADPETAAFVADPQHRAWLAGADATAAVDPSRYAAVCIAGGHGAMWDLPDDPGSQRIIAAIWERGGVVGAVCHGPAALTEVRLHDGALLVAGRRVAAFTDDEERAIGLDATVPFLLASRLRERGATHLPAANWAVQVVRDGRLVTGQNPASARGLAEQMVIVLRASAP